MQNQRKFDISQQPAEGPVECLGLNFPNDAARRQHFSERLRERLADPKFRQTPGFPKGSDADILRLSDPPYYTACPNPFLADFVRCYGRPYDPAEPYHREPFAVDVSVGKTDPLYKAHGYHTKVPHLAIVPSILHYTKPGDIVLDGFCGSGMTGVAAQWCGAAPAAYRQELEAQWKQEGRGQPEWGARRTILGDLSPAATFITANYNLPFDVSAFAVAAERILDEVEAEVGWMYETLHTDGKTKGRINYTVWSEVFSCPECGGEIVFLKEALDQESQRVRDGFPCPHCRKQVTKDSLQRLFEMLIDPIRRTPWRRIRLRPVLINYSVSGRSLEKAPGPHDIERLKVVADLPFPSEVPAAPFPIEAMYHGSRLAPKGFTCVHHTFLPRQAQAMSALWRRANATSDLRLRNMLLFWLDHAIWGMSLLNRYKPLQYGQAGGSQVNNYLDGVYYVPSQIAECSPWYNLGPRTTRLPRAFSVPYARTLGWVTTGDCSNILLPDDSCDYVFTDPPFGENKYYADLNFLVETWHRALTDSTSEAIVDRAKHKGINEYQELMRRCFAEYYRVLKPGRWMTVVFSNSSTAVWRAIQEAIGTASFVIADVRTLDKQQGSYRQVTSSAAKQDLVISAYKPTEALARRFNLGIAAEAGVWAFVGEHLSNVPVFVAQSDEVEVISERRAQMLHDRMIAFHVQRGLGVPLSGPDFFMGLAQRFPTRDDMYFLPEQVVEYDRKRSRVAGVRQLIFLVTDESSAIQWVRQQLDAKPQTFQELQPLFMKEIQAWAEYEQTVELRELLEQNFLCYDGRGPVPSQIHSYLSSNFREVRNLEKMDPVLVERAEDRWYVPDPGKAGDLEKLREKALIKEFEEYRLSQQRKLKLFRSEAVRAGFKAAYDKKDYRTIIDVGRKLPGSVLQEDEKLLMYFDVAATRLGED